MRNFDSHTIQYITHYTLHITYSTTQSTAHFYSNTLFYFQFQQATGGILYADYVGIHPYGQRPTEDWPNSQWGFGVVTDLLANYYSVTQKPLWITEDGTDDMTVQGEFPANLFDAVANSSTPTPFCYWFCWSDGMVMPYGVVDSNGEPKDSYYSYQGWTISHPSE
jgi:hypothetical protein